MILKTRKEQLIDEFCDKGWATLSHEKSKRIRATHVNYPNSKLNDTEVWSWFTKGFKYFQPVITFKTADFNFFFKSGNALYNASKHGDLRMHDDLLGI